MYHNYYFGADFFGKVDGFLGFEAIYFANMDEDLLKASLKLRNEKRVRLTSINQDKITLNAHASFAKRILQKSCYFAFKPLQSSQVLGVCSLVRKEGPACFLGIYTSKNYPFSYLLLKAGEQIAKDQLIKTIFLEVRKENTHAQNFFSKNGYELQNKANDFYLYKKQL